MFGAGHMYMEGPLQSSLFIILHMKCITLGVNSQCSSFFKKNEIRVLKFSEEPLRKNAGLHLTRQAAPAPVCGGLTLPWRLCCSWVDVMGYL